VHKRGNVIVEIKGAEYCLNSQFVPVLLRAKDPDIERL